MAANPKSKKESIVRKAARDLRALALSAPEGTFLGSERQIVEQLGVSRPTFRQAARLVEHDQLLAIKRGVHGGFYARRPDVSSVTNAAAIYLMSKGTSLAHLMTTTNALSTLAAKLAAQSNDAELGAEMQALQAELKPLVHRPQSVVEFHADEGRFIDLLARMANNPATELFLRALYRFGNIMAKPSVFEGHEDRMRSRRVARVRLMDAILNGDGEIAALLMQRQLKDSDWMSAAMLARRMDVGHSEE